MVLPAFFIAMPYSIDQPDKLPEHVQKMPAKQMRQWVAVWNSSYEKCTSEGGADCEAAAFRNANGVTKEMSVDIVDSTVYPVNLHYTELTAALLASDKPFDGLVAGEFSDMHGRAVKITTADLQEIADNTNALLESTRAESGDLAGLPIDEKQHEKGHASGWIVGVELAGDVLRIVPQWTELGRDLISKKIQRYFSATIDLAKKVIYGGTLTNWPATRDGKTGRVLLRPIELSQTLLQITPQATAENGTPEQPDPIEKEKIMLELTEQELSAKIAEAVQAALDAQPKPELGETELSQLAAAAELKPEQISELAQAIEARVEQRFQAKLAETKRDAQFTELATKVTGGTTEYPRALPVTADNLKAALLQLPEAQVAFWSDLCETIVSNGLTEFAEFGHGKELQARRELPAELATLLQNHINGGGNVAEWFEVAGLGDAKSYNLTGIVKE